MSDVTYVPPSVETPLVEPHYSSIDSEDEKERSSGFTKTISFTNSLPFAVNIIDRDGFSVTVKNNKAARSSTGYFMVYARYSIPKTVNINSNSLLNVDDNDLTPELRAIKAALARENRSLPLNMQPQVIVFQIAYRISSDMFKANGNTLHMSQLGITLTHANEKRMIVNPDSVMGRILNQETVADIPGTNFRVEINDPNLIHGSRYINVLNRIFKITPTIDKTKVEGIYVYQSEPPISGCESGTFYDFAKGDEVLSLHKTIEEAKTNGDIKAVREQARQEREAELERTKHEQKLEQIEREKELKKEAHESALSKLVIDRLSEMQSVQKQSIDAFVELQKQVQREKEDDRQREHDLELRRQRDEFDRRSAERKDTTELLKWGTAVVTGFVTLGFTLVKLSK